MRFAGRYVVPGIVFALLVVLVFWGGSVVGKSAGYWNTSLDITEYRRLLER